jgi:hypothetical protein
MWMKQENLHRRDADFSFDFRNHGDRILPSSVKFSAVKPSEPNRG